MYNSFNYDIILAEKHLEVFTLDWIKEAVMYNIYPLGFAGALRDNDFKLTYRLDKIYDWMDNFIKTGNKHACVQPCF